MASAKASTKAPAKTTEAAAPKASRELAGIKEAIRRLASGAVQTEEQKHELFDLLDGGK